MKVFDLEINLDDNGQKITAIKNVREAFGLGLGDAKYFVESFAGWDGARQKIRCTAEQLGLLVARNAVTRQTSVHGEMPKPILTIYSATEVEATKNDFSTNSPS